MRLARVSSAPQMLCRFFKEETPVLILLVPLLRQKYSTSVLLHRNWMQISSSWEVAAPSVYSMTDASTFYMLRFKWLCLLPSFICPQKQQTKKKQPRENFVSAVFIKQKRWLAHISIKSILVISQTTVYNLRKCLFLSHQKLYGRGQFIFYYEEVAQHCQRKMRTFLERGY